MAYPGSLGLGELLDRIFTTYRRNFLQLIAVAAIPYAALAPVLLLFVVPSIRTILAAGDTGQPPPGGFGGFLVGFFSAIAIMVFAAGVSQVASMTASWELLVNGSFRVRDVYARVLKRALALIAAGFLFGVIFFAGYLIVAVPGIIAAIAMSLTALALVVENKGPVEALRRSFDLTKGFRGRIFVCFVICYAASMALIYALMIPLILGSVALAKPGPEPLPTWFWAVFIFVEMFALIVPAPLNAIALAVVYHDARRCKEGFDIQQLLDALPAITPAAAPVQS